MFPSAWQISYPFLGKTVQRRILAVRLDNRVGDFVLVPNYLIYLDRLKNSTPSLLPITTCQTHNPIV
ncbi:hypothetical protein A2450_04410 [candidate division WWE3 bacterium RIFOXYC2_FULL_40_11]|nr:MAG: hypothetical protein A2450_04410 [candidate division WWE3 bacterium RIFOXYC2_FULL_40_11]OGC71101.1 MAG: hypothetical protein A2602_01245 [candidate division WWE3 bacterium RIFOXYD1_FULL_40_11]